MYDAAYYRTMEAFGQEKRDILVSEVDDARDSQEQAKEQFSSALEQFSALIDFEGGELETVYRQLETEFEQSEEKAAQVSQNINDVERVARALFREWQDELDAYTDQNLRNASEQQLEATQAQYEELIVVMRRAEDKMQPVLNAFRDQVLFLKHNLNARAIAALEGTVASLEAEVATLISDMEASIEEANRFIDEMGAST
jgi:histidinol-phosphate/aromatic aminotransferase/cobyric acid decarboxylase-like protein